MDVPLTEGSFGPLVPDANQPEVVIRGRVTHKDGLAFISIFLVNEQAAFAQNRDSAWLFQAKLGLETPDSQAVFVAHRLEAEASSEAVDPELPVLEMLYRDEVQFAVGHGTAVHATVSSANARRAVRIETDAAPRYEVMRTEAPALDPTGGASSITLDMQELAESDAGSILKGLRALVGGYASWLDQQRARIGTDEGLIGFESAASSAVAEGEKVSDALSASVDVLEQDPVAMDAFRFANNAMWQQRIRSEAVRHRRANPDETLQAALDAVDHPSNRSWRPFQLAFVLLNIPSLVDPTHAERTQPGLGDLLFFPTGGGKTEAYLGLTAFTLGIRRLQGVVAGRDGSDGVAVIMRYTLRLLTAQQFQRAAALMCACEVLRRDDPQKWGDVAFRIGMWVGGSVTPNRSSEAAKALEQERGLSGRGSGQHASPVQLVSCPWCGTDIDPGANARRDPNLWRTFVFCGDPYGRCDFTEKRSPSEGLPVLTVDEDIYRLLPSMIISTVDKWALLPWRGELRLLFGNTERRCTRHGYRSPDLDRINGHSEADKHNKVGTLPAAETVDVLPLRPPDLIIQDELHLISGPLGTMFGLYETAIDHLAAWRKDEVTVRPKLVASTATIRRAGDQMQAVFWRGMRVFPPPVLDLSNSYWAVQRSVDDVPGRRYVGICVHGLRLKSAEVRVFASILAAAQRVYERHGKLADPWMTLVGYFNALRELGGMRRLVEDEVKSRLRRADRRGLSKRVLYEVRELTSRIGSTDIPRTLEHLGMTFEPDRPKDAARPIDVVLATNMISVGVDVSRLGLMAVVGQPKTTAEYIQATSRVGRETWGPGLVFTIYNWARPRDLSHYESFEHYHATFYSRVEALSVTPFASRALDRGLSAVMASLIRQSNRDWNPEPAAAVVDRADTRVDDAITAVSERAADLTADVSVSDDVVAMAEARMDAWAKKQKRPATRLAYRTEKGDIIPLLESPTGFGWHQWTAPLSLRDVEPMVNLVIRGEKPVDDEGPDWAPPKAGDGSAAPATDDDHDPAAELGEEPLDG